MPLVPQNIPISFSQGLDTKTDPKQIVAGKMLVLRNVSMQSPQQFQKRAGFQSLSQAGGGISTGVGIVSYENELNILDGSEFYSYSFSQNAVLPKGNLVPTNISTFPILRNGYQQFYADSAINGNLKAYAWIDSEGTFSLRYSIVDSESGQFIVNDSQIYQVSSPTFTSPVKVLAIGSYFVFIYFDVTTGQNLYYNFVNTSTPQTLSSRQTITSDLNTSFTLFDAEVIGSNIVIAYGTSTNVIAMFTLSPTLFLSGQYAAAAGNTPTQAITVFGDVSGNSWVIWGDGTHIKALIANSNMSGNLVNAKNIDSISDCQNITGYVFGTSGVILYEHGPTSAGYGVASANSPGSQFTNLITQNTLNTSGTVGVPGVFNRGLNLSSKAIKYDGLAYFMVGFPTIFQSTYLLMNSSGYIVAKISQGLGGPEQGWRMLPEINQISSSQFQTVTLIKDELVAFEQASSGRFGSPPTLFTQTGIQSVQINFNVTAPSKMILGNDLHIAGGILEMYDGSTVVEHGFTFYPEGLGFTDTTSGGGIGIGASTAPENQVQYVALYEWIDNQGNLYRSAPSIPITVPLPPIAGITFTANTTAGSSTISSVSSVSGLINGQVVSDSASPGDNAFPAGTYIVSGAQVGSTSLVLSNPASGSFSGDTFLVKDLGTISVIVPTLRVTKKQAVSIVLYRTENNGTIFYRVTSPLFNPSGGDNNFIFNDITVDTITITDALPDSVIIGNEEIYTTGGEVENIAAPAFNALTTFKTRPIGIPSENTLEFWYGKQVVPGSPVEWSDEFTWNVDSRIGYLASAFPMDDKLILFGPIRKFYVTGDGPAPNGANNDFSESTPIAGVNGCINQNSIVEIPSGLIYQSPTDGFWLLDRSLQESYIGAPVEKFNSFKCVSSQSIPNSTKVSFSLNNGSILIYDYYVNQWEEDPVISAPIDACIYNGNLNYIQSDGSILQQQPGTFNDNGQVIPISFITGWLNFASIAGFQRVYELQIVGTYKSPHTLTVAIYVDFSDSPSQIVTIPVLTQPFPYNFRIHIKPQQCTSMQIEIIESQTGTPGEGFSLSALNLRVGAKQGLNKLPAGASY